MSKKNDELIETKDTAKESKKKNSYSKEKKRIINLLLEATPGSDEYKALLLSLNDLEKAHAIDKSRGLTGGDILKCATQVVTTTAMFIFESENPVRTKFLSFIPKVVR
jgi:hypothetical protein